MTYNWQQHNPTGKLCSDKTKPTCYSRYNYVPQFVDKISVNQLQFYMNNPLIMFSWISGGCEHKFEDYKNADDGIMLLNNGL